MGLIAQMAKRGCTLYNCITCRKLPLTSPYPYGDKRRDVARILLCAKLYIYLYTSLYIRTQFVQLSDFLLYRGCINKHISSHTHNTQTRNNSLWITQRVAPYRI
ncbi:hypothetical protein SFRURICE_020065 [Spodoptera frugiperda]|nr:hypothetical protein SFRURICE_020065 [Spodoptera frugiperda]